MGKLKVLAFKGSRSQTGIAFRHEFPQLDLASDAPSFEEIAERIDHEDIICAVPVWNSHQGEIRESPAFGMLFTGKAYLFRLWPKSILFECVSRVKPKGKLRSIISVKVAKAQCSKFINRSGADFIGRDSTVEAYAEFCVKTEIDAALCAPDQNDRFRVVSPNAANPLNFTTFALFGPASAAAWNAKKWGPLDAVLFPATATFFGVEMPLQSRSIPEEQHQLFASLADDARNISDIPKAVFVVRRRRDSCALLFESSNISLDTEVATEDGFSSKVKIIPNVGRSKSMYTAQTFEYMRKQHSGIIKHDFIRHIGTQTCFFACPALQLITHGFEQEVVEPVVRRMLAKYFELHQNGLPCNEMERRFFKRHGSEFGEKGEAMFSFTDVG